MSTALTHREVEELLGAFALDAVDDDERDIMEAHLAGCPRCRSEVAGYRETAALLAHGGARAPEGLWARISGTIEEPPPELDLAPALPLGPAVEARRSRRSVTLRAAVAMVAVAAALTTFLGVRLGEQDHRLDQITEAVSKEGLFRAASAAMSDPLAEKVLLKTFDGQRGAQIVRLADGSGYVVADTLHAIESDRTYQLWGLRENVKISLGVLGNDPDVASFKMVGPVLGFAITNEPFPGVDSTNAEPVAFGWIDQPPGEQAPSPS